MEAVGAVWSRYGGEPCFQGLSKRSGNEVGREEPGGVTWERVGKGLPNLSWCGRKGVGG